MLLLHRKHTATGITQIMTTGTVRFADSTDNSRTVRRKIDPTAGNAATVSPLTCAEAVIISNTASLHLGIANLLQSLGKEYITAMHELQVKCNKIKKLESEPEYKPISTRINFKLQATESVKETQGFKDLQAKVDGTLERMKKELREHVIECAKLEKAQLQDSARSHALSIVKNSIAIFSTAHGIDRCFTHHLAHELIREKSNTFLTHLDLTPAAFLTLYNTEYNATEETVVLPERAGDIVNGVARCAHTVLKASWDAYLAQAKQNEINISIKKCAKEILTSKSTEDAAMVVDAEPSLSTTQMDELIAAKAKKEVQRQMAILEQRLKAERGNNVSASLKKKTPNGNKETEKTKKPKKKGPEKEKVDDAHKDTQQGKKQRKPKHTEKKQQKTQRDGGKKKPTSSKPSTKK